MPWMASAFFRIDMGVINLIVQNICETLFLNNEKISDVIYHPRACKMNF